MTANSSLLQVENLSTQFHTIQGIAKAVNDVSFTMESGETVGIVGESGSGKSVTALSIIRLIKTPPGRITNGKIFFQGKDLLAMQEKQFQQYRGNKISMIFQEPMTSLNPLFTVGNQISEMIRKHMALSKKESWDRAIEMLKKVQIPSPERRVKDYPFQMSGGMRQRVMIAMALSCNPDLLIADEPTTALDVTIQAQMIDLILKLKEEFNTAIMMITHDMGVVAETAQQVNVMYAGQIVEQGDVASIFKNPKHPYTRSLLKSIPALGERSRHGRKRLKEIKGIVPSLFNLPGGCHFSPRCPEAKPECFTQRIKMKPLGEKGRVRCILY